MGLQAETRLGSIKDIRAMEGKVKAVTARALPATVSLFSEQNGASGSGAIVSPDGLILTAGHVIEGLDEVTAVFPDGKQARAEVLGANLTKDSAMVKLKNAGPWPWGERTASAPGHVRQPMRKLFSQRGSAWSFAIISRSW